MHEHFHPALYVDIYNSVFFRCLATIWPWYHTGGQEQERSQDVQMNFNLSMCSWEWFGVCWQWLDPSHKGSWRLIYKLLHRLNSTMLSRAKINANWQQFGVIKDALILLALLGKFYMVLLKLELMFWGFIMVVSLNSTPRRGWLVETDKGQW